MRAASWLLLALLSAAFSFAAEPLAVYARFCASCGVLGKDTITSHSGQFIIHGTSGIMLEERNLNTNRAPLITIGPQLAAVTAERIKRTFLDEIGTPDFFRDKIHMLILDRATADHPVTIVTKVSPDGFEYQMGVPPRLDQRKFAKAIVQVLMLEFANRHGTRSAEFPLWLIEGITDQVLSSVVPTYVINKRPVTYEILGYDRLASARELLKTNTGLTFHELSFPMIRTPAEREIFESCSHLLVHELLALDNGPRRMASFLAVLPSTLNWQTAFHRAYAPELSTPLDAEKWWALSWLDFRNHDENETWPIPLSLHRLRASLLTSLEFRLSTNSLPELRDVNLQHLLRENDFGLQKEVIARKLKQFYFLSFNLAPEVQSLLSSYQELLSEYIEKRTALPVQPVLRSDPEHRLRLLVNSTLRRLDELDQQHATIAAQATQSQSRLQ